MPSGRHVKEKPPSKVSVVWKKFRKELRDISENVQDSIDDFIAWR